MACAMPHFGRSALHPDPGWLFLIAGLTMSAALILIPANRDLEDLERQLEQLRAEDAALSARLRAHSDFLDALDRDDPALIRRLAAGQLNLVPVDQQPVLLTRSPSVSVSNWIDRTVRQTSLAPEAGHQSKLSELASGPFTLWLLGSSILSVFIGLMISPGRTRQTINWESGHALDSLAEEAPATDSASILSISAASRAVACQADADEPETDWYVDDGDDVEEDAWIEVKDELTNELSENDPPPDEGQEGTAAIVDSIGSAMTEHAEDPAETMAMLIADVEDEVDVLDEDEVEDVIEAAEEEIPLPAADRTECDPSEPEQDDETEHLIIFEDQSASSPESGPPEVMLPKALSPEIATPEVVSPRVLSSEAATPEVLSPEILSAEVATPEPVLPPTGDREDSADSDAPEDDLEEPEEECEEEDGYEYEYVYEEVEVEDEGGDEEEGDEGDFEEREELVDEVDDSVDAVNLSGGEDEDDGEYEYEYVEEYEYVDEEKPGVPGVEGVQEEAAAEADAEEPGAGEAAEPEADEGEELEFAETLFEM